MSVRGKSRYRVCSKLLDCYRCCYYTYMAKSITGKL